MASENSPEGQELPCSAPSLTVQGSRKSAIRGLLAFVLLCIAFGPELARGQVSAGLLVLLALLLPTAWANLKALLAPSRIVVSGDQLCIRHRTIVLRCPASNVDQMYLEEGKLKVLFADPDAVEPESSRSWLWRNFAKTSVHFEIPGKLFTTGQLQQVRRALGKSAEDPHETDDPVEKFHQTLSRLCPRVIATPALIALNTALFFAMVFGGADPLDPSIQTAIDWGANYGPRTLGGEWWRVLTSTCLHFGAIHLLFNMWVLWDFGRLVERMVGHVGFVAVYVLSGVLGSMASTIWRPAAVAAGASGAIFGLFGLLLGFLLRDRGSIPVRALKEMRASAVCFVLANVAFGLLVPRIDMAGHLGGLLCGLLCGLVMTRPLTPEALERAWLCNVKAVVVGMAAVALAVPLLPPPPLDIFRELLQLDQSNKDLFARYVKVLEDAAGLKVPPKETVRAIEDELLPGFREAQLRVSRLEREDPGLHDALAGTAKSLQSVVQQLDRLLAETKKE